RRLRFADDELGAALDLAVIVGVAERDGVARAVGPLDDFDQLAADEIARRHDGSQNCSRRAIAAPTRLSGVDAPDVRPTMTGRRLGSQPVVVTSSFDATGRWRIASADTRQSGSAMWNVGRDVAQIRARFAVLLLL